MSLISVLRDLLSWIHSSYSLAAVVFLHACEKRGEIQLNILFLVTLLPGLRSTCSWWHCFSRVNSIDHFLSSLSMMSWIPKDDVIIEKWVEWRSTRKLRAEEMDTSGEHIQICDYRSPFEEAEIEGQVFTAQPTENWPQGVCASYYNDLKYIMLIVASKAGRLFGAIQL